MMSNYHLSNSMNDIFELKQKLLKSQQTEEAFHMHTLYEHHVLAGEDSMGSPFRSHEHSSPMMMPNTAGTRRTFC